MNRHNFTRPCPEHAKGLARPSQVFVPVSARGLDVFDNGGDMICRCFTPELAERIAELINADAARA